MGEKDLEEILQQGMWSSAVAYDAETMAFTVRELLEEMGYSFTRDKDTKHFQKYIAGFVPVPKFAYVFVFNVHTPEKFTIKLYDTMPTHSGVLHFIDIEGINENNIDAIRNFLKKLAERLPRKPWEFFWSERFRYGLLAPEYLKAKKMWKIMIGQ